MRKCFLVFLSVLFWSSGVWSAPGEIARELPLPAGNITSLAFDGSSFWMGDQQKDAFFRLDFLSGKVVGKLNAPGYRPAGLAWDGKQLWHVDAVSTKLFRIQPSDGLVTAVIPSPVALPRALAWDGKALWLSDEQSRSVHRVDPADGTTISEIPFPGQSVDALAWDGRYLWVGDRLDDRLYAVHPESGEVLVALPAPGPFVSGLAVVEGLLWVADYQNDRLYGIKMDDSEHLILGPAQPSWVVFYNQLRNLGPDEVLQAELLSALPHELISQRVEAVSFFPQAVEVVQDRWGQKVARMKVPLLKPGEQAELRLKVKVSPREVNWVIYPHLVGGAMAIPLAIKKEYLKNESKYDIYHPIIQNAVKEAVGEEKNLYWMARRIYRYVHQKMHYERIGGWDVAPKVLARGSGSCSEYSFVFIAMCRAAGIPARYVGSLVMRKDRASWDDVFHRWVEIYLPPYGWIPVDPSRGDQAGEARRAASFGMLTADFLITTEGGGGSELLDWNYNHNQRYMCRNRCQVESEAIAEWSPEEPQD